MVGATDRVQAIFEQASPLSAQDRIALLDSACGGDTALRAEVESLLVALDSAGGFLEAVTVTQARPSVQPSLAIGTRVGAYQLRELIGEGGMGSVYRAEQDRPRRDVALKLIRIASEHSLRRFEFEAELLGQMNHPHVARVYEAGIVDVSGARQPFIAMELVHGAPLDVYLEQRSSNRRQIVHLFLTLARAVAAVHARGVIHRDLKPSNILVNDAGEPKVLDFGVGRLASDVDVTRTSSSPIGTPLYMAPEQADTTQVATTSADVWALGVMAYEALLQKHPLGLSARGGSLAGVLKALGDRPVDRPSSIQASFPRDLEAVLLKALERDPTRRYPTAAELADDLQRYLDSKPVHARRASTWYRTQMFVRRHRLTVAAASVAIVSLLAGTVVSIAMAIEANRGRLEAENQRQRAQAITDFLSRDLIGSAGALRLTDKPARDAVVKWMIEPARALVAQRYADQPLVEAAVRSQLADVLSSLGRGSDAVIEARRAVELYQAQGSRDSLDALEAEVHLGNALLTAGQFDEAEVVLRRAADRVNNVFGPDHVQRLSTLILQARVTGMLGRREQALAIAREAYERSTRALGAEDRVTMSAADAYASNLYSVGDWKQALPIMRQLVDTTRRTLGASHLQSLQAMGKYSTMLGASGALAEAEAIEREAVEGYIQTLGADHPMTLAVLNNRVGTLGQLGREAEAVALAKQVYESRARVLGADHADTLASQFTYAYALLQTRQHESADSVAHQTAVAMAAKLGPDHELTLQALRTEALALQSLGRLNEAIALSQSVLERITTALGTDHPYTAISRGELAGMLEEAGQVHDAIPLRRAVLEADRKQYGETSPEAIVARINLAVDLGNAGEFAEALELYRTAIDQARAHPALGPDHADTREYLSKLARLEQSAATRPTTQATSVRP